MQSRYYDPETGRFLNADGYVNANGDLIGFNMYAYCSNNPVMYTDPTGEFAEIAAVSILAKISAAITAVAPVIGVTIGVVLVVTVAVVAITQILEDSNSTITYRGKGHQGNIKDSGLTGVSDEEIQDRLRDPNIPGVEKKRLQREQKARENRNKRKRQGYGRSK